MRLIDADALRKEHCGGCDISIQQGCWNDPVCASLMWVNEAPTVDAVPVVRCKDCMFSTYFEESGNRKCRSQMGLFRTVRDDDFCSDGERKEDDD